LGVLTGSRRTRGLPGVLGSTSVWRADRMVVRERRILRKTPGCGKVSEMHD
jgi:hypothetical protein